MPIGVMGGSMTSLPAPAPAAPAANRLIKILAAVVAISGVGEVLAAVLYIAGSRALVFLVSGFGDLGLSVPLAELVVVLFGLFTIGAAAGIWSLRPWGLALGLGVSLVAIVVGLLARDFASFIFIRGVIVFVVLVRIRKLFLLPEHSITRLRVRPESRPPPLGSG
jgi:hypothetical protein